MTITVKHTKVSAIADGADTSLVRPSDWNADHALTGLGTAAELNAGVANGAATLDAGGTVPLSQIPASIQGTLNYQGTWNASTNTPTLTSSVGTKGYLYAVSVAGSTNLNGITDWKVGDMAVYSGSVWQKIDNTDAVTSVNGYTGAVVLANSDIAGFGTMSTQNANAVAVTGGSVNGTTLGASTPAAAKVTTLDVANGLTLAAAPGTAGQLLTSAGTGAVPTWSAPPSGFGFKNRLINGAMTIDQRNAGASVTLPSSAVYTVDRWAGYCTQSSKLTAQQNAGAVTPPAGFSNYLGLTSASAYSVVASDLFELFQPIEGVNIADLAWGTASAKDVTLTFKVYSSLTGTFGGGLVNSGNTRNYPFTYSVPVANTWTDISVTVPGSTSGTWLTNNGIGINVLFGLGAGSNFTATANAWNNTTNGILPTGAVSVVGTNAAKFYITGVQLEVGSKATTFDVRDYGREFIMCQRYFCQSYPYGNVAGTNNGGQAAINALNGQDGNQIPGVRFPVEMRSAPTTTIYSCSGTAATLSNTSLADAPNAGTWGFTTAAASGSRAVVGAGGLAAATAYVYHYVASAEL